MPQNFPALLHAGISPRNRVKELKKIGETHHQISPHIFNMSLQPCFAAWRTQPLYNYFIFSFPSPSPSFLSLPLSWMLHTHQSATQSNTGRGGRGGRVLLRVRIGALAFSLLRQLIPAAAELKDLHDEPCHHQEHLNGQRRAESATLQAARSNTRARPVGRPLPLDCRASRSHQAQRGLLRRGLRPCWRTVSNVPATSVWGRSAHCLSSTCPTESPRHAR